MWLNQESIIDFAVSTYRKSLLNSCPNHVVIDGLFNESKLDDVMVALHDSHYWQTQKHTYAALYVDNAQWNNTSNEQRFVHRGIWRRDEVHSNINNFSEHGSNIAQSFLSFLREEEFMSLLSRIFNVRLTDMNVEDPDINTNYFRLDSDDFVEQHADDSPGREVCMLLYLNKAWKQNSGGELVFRGRDDKNISVAPLYNRCVLFDPSSEGSEHWVKRLNTEYAGEFRYNVTSWYWSE